MTNEVGLPISSLLDRLPLTSEEKQAFLRDDPASVRITVRVLIAAAHFFNAIGVEEFGGRHGAARDRRLVEQVVAAAFQQFGGIDPHPSVFDKAAMLLRGITQGHPFNDGNKRTGFVIASYYLREMGHSPPSAFRTSEVVNFCVRVSAGQVRELNEIARELRRLWEGP